MSRFSDYNCAYHNLTHHAASSLLLLFGIPIADSIGSVLPQTLGSALSDPDDRS